MSHYRVNGHLRYRGHEPNTVFEASLDPGAEQRAIGRGAISLIESSTPSIQPGSFRLPDGWHTKQEEDRANA